MAWYSASVLDGETVGCRLVLQHIQITSRNGQHSVVDLRVNLHPTESASQKAYRSSELWDKIRSPEGRTLRINVEYVLPHYKVLNSGCMHNWDTVLTGYTRLVNPRGSSIKIGVSRDPWWKAYLSSSWYMGHFHTFVVVSTVRSDVV